MRVYNFSPGPATLPESVLIKIQSEFLNYHNLGASIVEISHRSKDFLKVMEDCKNKLGEYLFSDAKGQYEILFLQGGASINFFMIPMNLLKKGKADYIETGSWAKKAIKEATRYGEVNVVASSADKNFSYIPKLEASDFSPDAKYLYLCSNNTIYGTQYHDFPTVSGKYKVGDFSSDILSRKLDLTDFGIVFAGAQKNLAPAGVAIVAIRKDVLAECEEDLPTMCSYKAIAAHNSQFNTSPVFPIYVMNHVLDWIAEQGGISQIEANNRKKAEILYSTLDDLELYCPTANFEDRSLMNVTFVLSKEELTQKFLDEAAKNHFVGLKGHRSVGGMRASIYNAFPLEGIEKFADFLKHFAENN